MSVGLTKYQKQELGAALSNARFSASDFIFAEEPTDENGHDYVSLSYRNSTDQFFIRRAQGNNNSYYLKMSVPGTRLSRKYGGSGWETVVEYLYNWAEDVKKEHEAVDPWMQEAEDMADDDGYFTIDELPKVDKAIEHSLDDLRQKAIEHGKSAEQIQEQLDDIKRLLQKTARSSTKSEWMSIFKGIILEKLIDWGMSTALFSDIIHTLVTSAQDITQLAEHASRYLP